MIRVDNLVKKFGEVTAVDGVSFSVAAGEIFAFLGPNVAGKTTTIQMLTTLLRPDSGEIRIDGLDPPTGRPADRPTRRPADPPTGRPADRPKRYYRFMSITKDPHAGQPVLASGPAPREARLGLILVHGRGVSAEDILGLAAELQLSDVACLAPQAAGHTWYPYSFLSPIEQNEPGITSGLGVISRLIDELGRAGLPPERIGLLGFSQGACLSLEFAARNARRYAGVFGLSGGLIGPPGTPRTYSGAFDGTPVFLGCSDIDSHIPLQRVHESTEVFRRMGAAVDERIYPRMGHTVNRDELDAVRNALNR